MPDMERGVETDIVTFTWRIENFSMCPLKRNVPLQSPSFHMGSLFKTEWHLNLYPKGKSDDHVVCDICRENDTGPGTVTIECQFSFVIAEGVSKYKFKSVTQGYSRQLTSSHKLMKMSELVEKKNALLPRGILTIQCRMWEAKTEVTAIGKATAAVKALVNCLYEGKADAPSCDIPEELYAMSSQQIVDMKRKMYPYINEYSAHTRFATEKRSFIWPIRNVSSLKLDQKLSVPLACSSDRAPPLIMTLSFKGTEETAQIDIRKQTRKDVGPIYVICKLVVLDVEGREHVSSENERHFDSPNQDEVWSFPPFFTRKKLGESKCMCLPNDVLRLHCYFTISVGADPSVIEEYNFTSIPPETCIDTNEVGTMIRDMQSFYVDKKLFDVELRVKGRTLQAHKAVLGSRSPVFAAMFEHETAEKNSNTVDITDVDAKTLERLLLFMYTDKLDDNLKSEQAIRLYSAADKYQVIALKKKCSDFLISCLSVNSVFNVLVLADMHQDRELKMVAERFLFEPPYEAFLSSEFETVIDCRSPLARATIRGWINKLKSDMALNV